jgi:putative cell wall-binding protein
MIVMSLMILITIKRQQSVDRYTGYKSIVRLPSESDEQHANVYIVVCIGWNYSARTRPVFKHSRRLLQVMHISHYMHVYTCDSLPFEW